ncbi:DUF1858 domain-containing protein [Treponema pectinovorum]|uniref:DUF1858 domain-containing protein n=1 Tax=Treponema pectinovorum TaxID=164 RepID=UPI0021C35DAD|nr:DUF1858 domain-containing protein [Treponema pectinovorum]
MNITKETKVSDLIEKYPFLKKDFAKINPKFKMLQTPMANIMLPKATVQDMIERSGMEENELISAIQNLINESSNEVSWEDKISTFKKMDVRGAQGNFFPALREQACKMKVGEGIEIIQKFEPLPLYEVMDGLGFERLTKKVGENEWHVYFYRTKIDEAGMEIPFRPAALLNFPIIDEDLGNLTVNFWDLTWNNDKRYLPYETRLLLSLTNAVGAGRMRQATRELVKAYVHGIDSAAFDDVFELLAWNQGIGFFSSEIGPSTLFKAYKHIKNREKAGIKRDEICNELMEQFGEKNPDVKV